MNLSGCFTLISGPPGIGKTTFCKAFRDYLQKNSKTESFLVYLKPILISYDEIIDKNTEFILINQNEGNWKKSRILIQNLTKHLVDYLNQDNSYNQFSFIDYLTKQNLIDSDNELNGKIIKKFSDTIQSQSSECMKDTNQKQKYLLILILDDIFYYENMRYIYFKAALESKNLSYYCLSFKPKDINFLRIRNKSRDPDDKLSENVIRNIFDKFEYPNQLDWEKRFSKCELVESNLELNETLFEDLVKSLVHNHELFLDFKQEQLSLKQIKEMNRISGEKSCENLVHRCDIILRKLIKEKIQKANKQELKIVSQVLNERKAQILDMIKNTKSDLYQNFFKFDNASQFEIELNKLLEYKE